MAKGEKKIAKTICYLILGIALALLLRGAFPFLVANTLLKIPSVERNIGRMVADYAVTQIDKNINGKSEIGKIEFHFWNKIVVKEFSIVSSDYSEEIAEFRRTNSLDDTLVRVKTLTLEYSPKTILKFKDKIYFESIAVDGGVFNIQQESAHSSNLNRIFPAKEKKKKENDLKLEILLGKIDIDNFRFALSNLFHKSNYDPNEFIDFANLNLHNIHLDATEISYKMNNRDTVLLNLNALSARDVSGFGVENMSGKVAVTSNMSIIENVSLSDGYTNLKGDYFFMKYNSPKSMASFIDSVRLGFDIDNSLLDFRTIGKITPNLAQSTLQLAVNGRVEGPITALESDRVIISTTNGETIANLSNISLTGLPKPEQTYLKASIDNATTNGKDLAKLISELTGSEKINLFDQMPPTAIYTYKGELGGTLLNLNTRGSLRARSGDIVLNTTINTADKKNGLKINGNYELRHFDAGNLLGTTTIGKISAKGEVNVVGKGNDMMVKIDSLHIGSIELLDREITDIKIDGRYLSNRFEGRVVSSDPKLSFDLDGIIPVSGNDTKRYIATVNVFDANLKELGIDKSNRESHIAMSIRTDLEQTQLNEFLGEVLIDDVRVAIDDSKYNLGNIKIGSLLNNDTYTANLVSDFMNINYNGEADILEFISRLKEVIVDKEFSNLMDNPNDGESNAIRTNYSLDIETFNTQGICALLKDGLYIQSGTKAKIDLDDSDNYNISLNSGRIALGENYLRNLSFSANNSTGQLRARVFSKDVVVSRFKVDSTRIDVEGADNFFKTRLRFHNDSTGENQTNLLANLSILKNGFNIDVEDSDIQLKGEKWEITPSRISIIDSLITIDGLKIEHNNQSLFAQGTLSRSKRDSLGISVENFDLGLVDLFLDKKYNLEGYLSGRSVISLNPANNRMYASFRGDSISINNTPLGETNIRGRWNPDNKNYDLLLRTRSEGNTTCDIRGSYSPENSYLDISSKLNDLSLTYFEPFLTSVAKDISGSINGDIRLFGNTGNLSLTGENCYFDNLKFTLGYTNVPYTINGPIEITENGITLKNNTITDNYNGKAIISGGVTYKNFKDLKIDTKVRLNNIQALATTIKENPDFYGDAFASGEVNIYGDLEHLNLDVNAQTQPNTFVHIPISKSSNATRTNLLTFINEEKSIEIDPYDTLYLNKKGKNSSPMKIGVNVQVTANENAEIWLEIDKVNGDIIKARGNGRVNIAVSPTHDFTLKGNYSINQGSYHFVLMNLTSRDFTIQEGSTVTMNGSPTNIDLNITGQYKRKAVINRLISDTSSVSTPRLVEANIYIKGKLTEPQISFGIDIPDLDPTIQARVQSALNTEEKIQKQVAALLVSGSFIPDMDNGISQNSSNLLYTNVSGIISDQVEKIFSQLGLPVDLGVNYTPGERNSHDAFEVALSTQMFNNRVSVNGNIGNDPYADYNGRNIIGNIDVDIKMDKQGKVRLNLFSHSTDSYSNDLEESQKNGIGVSYQREFNSFRDLFRRKSPRQKEYEKILRQREKEARAKAKREKAEQREKSRAEKRANKRR